MYEALEEHRRYLLDEVRLSAYREAIAQALSPGAVVLDLGSGTGILGLLCCAAGAGRVYAVEQGTAAGWLDGVFEANGYGDRVQVIKGLSTRLDLPERVDLVVADQLNPFGLGAGLVTCLEDARRRHLREGGLLMPARLDLKVAPVQTSLHAERVDFWRGHPGTFDFAPVHSLAVNTPQFVRFRSRDTVALAQTALSIELGESQTGPLVVDIEFPIDGDVQIHGLAGWFVAELFAGTSITNSPLSDKPVDRAQLFLPCALPMRAKDGDSLRVLLRIDRRRRLYRWTLELQRDGHVVERVRHDSGTALLLDAVEIARTHPAAVFDLSPRGRAALHLLQLSDDGCSRATIERTLLDEHPRCFRDQAAAAGFASEFLGSSAALTVLRGDRRGEDSG